MKQETGETRDAIIEADNRKVQQILDANKNRKDPYWIVIFATPSKQPIDGKPTLIKHIKPYAVKPPSRVGMIVGEVNNSKGTVDWEVNFHQKPMDWNAFEKLGGKPTNDVVIETTSIPGAYITK